ncbi:hypothetical protein ACOME3_001786 [Neoechinorhynchus agilis]
MCNSYLGYRFEEYSISGFLEKMGGCHSRQVEESAGINENAFVSKDEFEESESNIDDLLDCLERNDDKSCNSDDSRKDYGKRIKDFRKRDNSMYEYGTEFTDCYIADHLFKILRGLLTTATIFFIFQRLFH